MKLNLKSIFSLLVALALILGVAGCKKADNDPSGGSSSGGSAQIKNEGFGSDEDDGYSSTGTQTGTQTGTVTNPNKVPTGTGNGTVKDPTKVPTTSGPTLTTPESKPVGGPPTSSDNNSGGGSNNTPEYVPEEDETEPRTVEPAGTFVPILRFVAASDTHITGTQTKEANRLRKLFSSSFAYAESHSTYKSVDAFIFAGDVSDSGLVSQYQALNSIINESTANKNTEVMMVMGNHGFYEGTQADFVNTTGQPLNCHKVIKGFHFIGISLSSFSGFPSSAISYLSSSVSAAAKDDPKKPIFTFQHPHLKGTVYLSNEWGSVDSDQIKGIFNQYPQVVNFSGHSHGPINVPQSFWQGGFTALNTGTLSYFEMAAGMTDGVYPPNVHDAGQYYMVEVDANNKVRIMPYNLLTDDFFHSTDNTDPANTRLVYEIDEPSNPSTFRYKNRENQVYAPSFKPTDNLTIEKVTPTTVTVKIPTALDKICLYNYDMVMKSKDGKHTVEYKAFYEFYFEPTRKSMTYTIKGLNPDTEYTLSVTPVNAYGRKGSPISTTVKTDKYPAYTYTSVNPVNFSGTFTNFDSMSSLTRSTNTYAYGGSINGDVFAGDWDSNDTASEAKFALATNKGYNGSKALEVWATNDDNRGLYVFATNNNKFTTKFAANDYLRVWVDFTNVEFRKMNFGLVSKNGGIYTTDEGDGRNNQKFFYLPEGSSTWQTYYHGDDGCFGDAQNSPVKGFKGWLAFPVNDFLYRSVTGSDGAAQGAPFEAFEFVGVHVFWDYSDNGNYVNKKFYLDELQLVKDYKVFDKY